MKVAFYLGSFNPPHYGHCEVIRKALEDFKMDKVVVVPAMHNPTKKDKPAPMDLRISWWNKVIAGSTTFENKVEVDNIETQLIPPYYSYATLHALKNKYCNDEVYMLVGADVMEQINDWMNGGQILKDWDFLVVDRDPNYSISSSAVRKDPFINQTFVPRSIRDEVFYYFIEHR